MSILIHGGGWSSDLQAGIARRSMNDSPTTSAGGIDASRRRHPKLIKYYTDAHDVDEDMRTISLQGGRWTESMTGFARRSMVDTSTATWYTVAYKDKNTIPSTG